MQSSRVEAEILPNVTSNTTTVLFLSNQRISYPEKFTFESGTAWSSIVSVIPIIAVSVLLTIHLIWSFFENKLVMFICRKRKPFFVSDSHLVELMSEDIWIGTVATIVYWEFENFCKLNKYKKTLKSLPNNTLSIVIKCV